MTPDHGAPATDPEIIDMTEVAAAIARLNNREPPPDRVTVPASTFPFSEKIKKEEAEAAAAAAAKEAATPKIGDTDEDGWKYAGVSPMTGQPLYVAPQDSGVMKWKNAINAVQNLKKQGKPGVHVPSEEELTQMFNYEAALGGFKKAKNPAGYYWSSSPDFSPGAEFFAWMATKCFDDGENAYGHTKKDKRSVRLVRS